MWLINTTSLELHNFIDASRTPDYAILSHCWGEEEMNFKDFHKKRNCTGAGYSKIVNCCRFVRESFEYDGQVWRLRYGMDGIRPHRGFDWVWIDTVCIDQSSSAELSEAINSMYSWYHISAVCVALLEDVQIPPSADPTWYEPLLRQSRWFTRGWTLQELIAPDLVCFVNATWTCFGCKNTGHHDAGIVDIKRAITWVSGIPENVLGKDVPPRSCSVAKRMSWASCRRTTRLEDQAYCLLGLFGVNMPLIYGEGSDAFQRLQHAIRSNCDDESIFAWYTKGFYAVDSMLARSPVLFSGCGSVSQVCGNLRSPFTVVPNGWLLKAQPYPCDTTFSYGAMDDLLVVRLRCAIKDVHTLLASHCVVVLARTICGHYLRVSCIDPVELRGRPFELNVAGIGIMDMPLGRNPLVESCIKNGADWQPSQSVDDILIHKETLDVYSCYDRKVYAAHGEMRERCELSLGRSNPAIVELATAG